MVGKTAEQANRYFTSQQPNIAQHLQIAMLPMPFRREEVCLSLTPLELTRRGIRNRGESSRASLRLQARAEAYGPPETKMRE